MLFTKNIRKGLPVTLEDARAHLRIGDFTGDDPLIISKLESAVGVAEDITGRLIASRSVALDVLLPPGRSLVDLPVYTASVTEVSFCGDIVPKQNYKHLTSDVSSVLQIDPRFSGDILSIKANVGYSEKDLPGAIKAAVLFILGTLYDNESDQIIGRSVSELSLTAEKLLQPWRVHPYRNV